MNMLDIAYNTVWAVWNEDEWVGKRFSGEIIAAHKYQELLFKKLRELAANSENKILAIASVSRPASRKPKTNKPKTPPRPR